MNNRVKRTRNIVIKSILVATISTVCFVQIVKSETMSERYVAYGLIAGNAERCLNSTAISDIIPSQQTGILSFNLRQMHNRMQYMFGLGVSSAYKEKMMGDTPIDCSNPESVILVDTAEKQVLKMLNN